MSYDARVGTMLQQLVGQAGIIAQNLGRIADVLEHFKEEDEEPTPEVPRFNPANVARDEHDPALLASMCPQCFGSDGEHYSTCPEAS